jgi:hypothetical protein
VALSYTPNWSASVDAVETPVRPLASGLLAVDVPAAGTHSLRLRYRWSAWERACHALSAAVAGAWIVSWLRSRQDRRLKAPGSPA